MTSSSEAYHPHWEDRDGVVHIGNFTGPFTACGRSWSGWFWRNCETQPATCVACIDYVLRKP